MVLKAMKADDTMGGQHLKKLLARFRPNRKSRIEWLATPNGSFAIKCAPIELILAGKGNIVQYHLEQRLKGNPA
jgi:hypothetical protein